MQEDAGGCRRVREDARRMPGFARGCLGLRGDAGGLDETSARTWIGSINLIMNNIDKPYRDASGMIMDEGC
ncbi:MAG: hypothetical protein LBR80_12735 [Deltaproteobacteria bacterium]|jgi:hypothetical protein|nr:hypothetical protein [Deltaproteobacteria bacterium]